MNPFERDPGRPTAAPTDHEPGDHEPGDHEPGDHEPAEDEPGAHRPGVGDVAGDDAGATAAGTVEADPHGDGWAEEPGPFDQPGGAHTRRRRLSTGARLLITAVAVLTVVAVVGVIVATRDQDGTEDVATTETTAASGESVGVFGTTDGFDRADAPDALGALSNGSPWSAEAGTWGVRSGEAYLAQGNGEARSFAVVGLGGQGDGAAQVRMPVVRSGSGLVFRYKGPYNYWALVAVPEVATWNVIKVVDGRQEVVGNTGQRTAVADGTTIAVRLEGDRIDVIVNGRVLKTVDDPALAGVGRIGLTARGERATEARWDDFVVALPGNRPLPAPSSTTAAAGGAGDPSSTTASTAAPPGSLPASPSTTAAP